MSRVINVALRLWEFICTTIVMALIGNIIADAYSGNPSSINYTMFCASFAMLSLIWLLPAAAVGWDKFALAAFAFDALNALFWFCAAIALAAKLEVHSCTNHHYLIHNEITNGARNMTERCREAQASTAFLWFGWAAFMVSAVMTGAEALGGGRSRITSPKSGPSMRQV